MLIDYDTTAVDGNYHFVEKRSRELWNYAAVP